MRSTRYSPGVGRTSGREAEGWLGNWMLDWEVAGVRLTWWGDGAVVMVALDETMGVARAPLMSLLVLTLLIELMLRRDWRMGCLPLLLLLFAMTVTASTSWIAAS